MSREKVSRKMTALSDAPPLPLPPLPPQEPKVKSPVPGLGALFHLSVSAVAVWAAGMGLHYGYHLSVPFMPTWLSLMAGLLTLGHGSSIMASAWHYERGRTAAQIAAQVRAGELAVEALAPQVLGNLKGAL